MNNQNLSPRATPNSSVYLAFRVDEHSLVLIKENNNQKLRLNCTVSVLETLHPRTIDESGFGLSSTVYDGLGFVD